MSALKQLRQILPATGLTERQARNFCSKLRESGQHLLWTGAQHRNGSGMVEINRKTLHAHRVVFAAFNPYITITGKYVTQSCGISCCCAPKCLKLLDKHPAPGSRRDNLDGLEEVAAVVGASRVSIENAMRRLDWNHFDPST